MSRIGEIQSLLPSQVSILALTATITKNDQVEVSKTLLDFVKKLWLLCLHPNEIQNLLKCYLFQLKVAIVSIKWLRI